tara:strand:+ start:7472 stop:7693 length:222 start_codon:yes stop_codon:yes gene_type:complete
MPELLASQRQKPRKINDQPISCERGRLHLKIVDLLGLRRLSECHIRNGEDQHGFPNHGESEQIYGSSTVLDRL